MKTCLFAAAILGGLLASAKAANIVHGTANDDTNIIAIEGDVTDGDADHFRQIAATITGKTIVFLNSRGGRTIEAMIIGEMIRSHG